VFVLIVCLKQIFLSTTKFGKHKKIWGSLPPKILPVSEGLGRTVARKSSIWGLHVYAGG